MFRFLVDTCVWLDAAKDPGQQPLLRVVKELVDLNELKLIVPRIVLDEFVRNKDRIIQESGRSLSGVFKRVKDAVSKFGDESTKRDTLNQLNDVDHRIPQFGESVNTTIALVEELLNGGLIVETSDEVMLRCAQRALSKTAPFHRQRNSIGDSIIFETYADQLGGAIAKERFAFITHNINDFSDINGNKKTPHPDLASHFSKIKSLYFISLAEAVRRVKPDLVSELMIEHEAWVEEPRTITELLDAIEEITNKIWYDRHKCREQLVVNGEVMIVEKETFPIKDHSKRPIQRGIWDGALSSATRMEEKYGKENLGPWTKFEWGMLNGKLSALRWALGEDWDQLYT